MYHGLRSLPLVAALWLPIHGFAATVTVNQVNLTFDPADITIQTGDTVEWIWSSGSHTVTSGTGAADPDVGSLFDTPLNSASPTASYTFDQPGDYDYFCRPHEGAGMAGIVRVVDPPPFVRIGTVDGPPDAADCSDPLHHGRMIVDNTNDVLYFCTGGGWQTTPPAP